MMTLSDMIRFPWEKKVWGIVVIIEIYLVIELGVSFIE